jgi:hypothetical protein
MFKANKFKDFEKLKLGLLSALKIDSSSGKMRERHFGQIAAFR